jgi:hypothetical protein
MSRADAEEAAFAKGDNGIGFGDIITATEAECLCALPPEDLIARWGSVAAAKGKLVLVAYQGKAVPGRVGDVMPHKANIKNGAGIDLNPGFQVAFGVKPPFLLKGARWDWADDLAPVKTARILMVTAAGRPLGEVTVPVPDSSAPTPIVATSKAEVPSSPVRGDRVSGVGWVSAPDGAREVEMSTFLQQMTQTMKDAIAVQSATMKPAAAMYLPGGYATLKALAIKWVRKAEEDCFDRTKKVIAAQQGFIDEAESSFDWNKIPAYLREPIRQAIHFLAPSMIEQEVALLNHAFEGDWAKPVTDLLNRGAMLLEPVLGMDIDGDGNIGSVPAPLASIPTKGAAAAAAQAATGAAAIASAPEVK